MNKKIALKIVLMLIIICLTLLIKTTTVQADPWPGVWYGNASNVAQSSDVFCRDYSNPLSYYTDPYEYRIDGSTSYYGKETTYAYIFNFLDRGGYSRISYSPAQQAFWSTPEGGGVGGNTSYLTGYNSYLNYIQQLNAYRQNNGSYELNSINAENAKLVYENSIYKYGPIKVQYPSWNEYGLEFSVWNGGQELIRGEDQDYYTTYDGTNLYIFFSQTGISKARGNAKLKIEYSYLETCYANITPIKNVSDRTEMCWCEIHQGQQIDHIMDLDYRSNEWQIGYIQKNGIIHLFRFRGMGNPTTLLHEMSDLIDGGGYYYTSNFSECYVPTGAGSGLGAEYYRLTKFNCQREGTTSSMGQGKCGHELHASELQKLVWVDAGKTKGEGSIEIDLHLIPTANIYLTKYNSIIETKEDNDNPQGTALGGANFTYKAYQVWYTIDAQGNRIKHTEELRTYIDGNGICKVIPAERTYDPYSETQYWEDRPSKDDDGNNITIKKGDDIYVLITETKSPKGYKILNQPICMRLEMIYTPTSGTYYYWPTFAPGDWKDVLGNKLNWYKWNWDQEHDPNGNDPKKKYDFPNAYNSDSGDHIMVESKKQNGETIYLMSVFDEAVIEELTLLKVDADNNNALLNGAKFKATFENVKEFYYGNNKFSGTVPFSFTVNGSIKIKNVVFIDENKPIKITLEEIDPPPATAEYYYKKLEGPIVITIEHTTTDGLKNATVTYNGTEKIDNSCLVIKDKYKAELTIPNLRLIDLSGKVWLDGNTGIKPVVGPDGKYTEGEKLVSNVLVELTADTLPFDNTTATYTEKTRYTNEQGQYSFKGLRWNKKYELAFNYDGIHYIGTDGADYYGAKENKDTRTSFNNKFKTIMYGQSGTGVELDYDFIEIEKSGKKERKSTLKTLDETNTAGKLYPTEINNHLEMGSVKDDFKMTANITKDQPYTAHTTNLNLGLVGRGTDLALYTNVYQADVTINGQTTTYNYDTLNKDKFNLDVDLENQNLISSQTSDENNLNDYSLYLYSTDYSYRIRNYISSEEFIDDYNAEGAPDGSQTGDELKVYVTYRLQLENQTKTNSTVSKVLYSYDDRYTLTGIYYLDGGTKHYLEEGKDYHKAEHYELTRIEIEKDFEFKGYDVETLYLEFQIINFDEERREYPYLNFAEIIEYQTENGLIDVDSAPGNTFNENINIIEDDYDEANGIKVQIKDENRSIEGYVWDDTNKNGKRDEKEPLINDVIVQLIELKEINGTNYEYIWQETKSGSKAVKRVATRTDANGNVIWDNYSHSEEITDGQYKFEGFIPGDYIIRFIYGDGTTYDLTNNVIKYNGQDYKSSVDSKYNSVWYNNAGYDDENANNARDNEARRLETMAWSAEVDAKTGILLKLLDVRTVDALNVVEKETLKAYYNEKYDPDVNEIGNVEIAKLLKEVTLANTWMCAETSKIKVPVEAENLEGEDNTIVDSTIKVNGIETNYKYEFNNVGLGLVKRPETNIELSKKLKQMTVIASNGQTILSAYLDENGNLQGQTDSLTVIPGTEWSFEVYQTDVNTVLDGANLEFIYDISVTNNSESDLLSKDLMELYNSTDINTYREQLATYSGEVKTAMRSANNSYTLGAHLGSAYYTGIADSENSSKVLTEVTNINDYINNELEPKAMTGLKVAGSKEHYLYDVSYNLQKATINNVLEAEVTTGKMAPTETVTKYSVTLAKDPLSATGTLNFKNYIAEVMSYSNAAGRRATTSTPGNAEAVNKNSVPISVLEPDETSAEEINLEAAPGGDEKTVYVWLAVITIAVAVTAIGTFTIKKYIVK